MKTLKAEALAEVSGGILPAVVLLAVVLLGSCEIQKEAVK